MTTDKQKLDEIRAALDKLNAPVSNKGFRLRVFENKIRAILAREDAEQAKPVCWIDPEKLHGLSSGICAMVMLDNEKRGKSTLALYTSAPAIPEGMEQNQVKMILYCPACGKQHIDAPDERTEGWSNPPHKSHLCHGCGHIWRPADVPTEGVAEIKTCGENDNRRSYRNSMPAIPSGMALVPVDPTEAMLDATDLIEITVSLGFGDDVDEVTNYVQSDTAKDVYKAMIAAAQQQRSE